MPRKAIDDNAARGLRDDQDGSAAKGFDVLFESKPLLVLAACLALFHLGNGGLLPLYGLAVVQSHHGNAAATVALTIVVAQAVMIPAALIAMRMAGSRGDWLVILITFIAPPVRGLVARLLNGTGRVNVGQGAVMTVQGVGASLSPAFGGWMAQAFGYSPAFLIMGSLSLGSLALWLVLAPMLRPACAPRGA